MSFIFKNPVTHSHFIRFISKLHWDGKMESYCSYDSVKFILYHSHKRVFYWLFTVTAGCVEHMYKFHDRFSCHQQNINLYTLNEYKCRLLILKIWHVSSPPGPAENKPNRDFIYFMLPLCFASLCQNCRTRFEVLDRFSIKMPLVFSGHQKCERQKRTSLSCSTQFVGCLCTAFLTSIEFMLIRCAEL